MSKVGTIVLGSLAATGIALGGVGTFMAYMNQPRKEVEGRLEKADLTEIAGTTVDPNAGDIAVPLSHKLAGGNSDIRWHCGKVGMSSKYEGTWEQIGGALAFNPDSRRLIALQITFLMDSFTGTGREHPAPDALTNKLRTSWFDIADHPVATFTATAFTAQADVGEAPADAVEGWTHLVEGTFDLNGVTKEIAVPARIAMSQDSFTLDASLVIDRREYNIDGDAAGSVVDDEVEISASIMATMGGDAMVMMLVNQIDDISELNSDMRQRIAQLETEVTYLRDREAQVSPRVNVMWRSARSATADNLPDRFVDTIDYPLGGKFSFDMVLVTGDDAQAIPPFYMSATEVTWDMLSTWAHSDDIGPDLAAQLQQLDLRPSPPYGGSDLLEAGMEDHPAIGMSRTTAEAFCLWLSEHTGRTYRLPTEKEWELALELGGGIPDDREEMLKQATFLENVPRHEYFDELLLTQIVGTNQPNALGIYDMIGNAAEWVIPEDPNVHKVRGGYFRMPLDTFTPAWQAIEDQKVWNATYPQKPVSRFWYKDFYFTGIRLVCEPVNVPE